MWAGGGGKGGDGQGPRYFYSARGGAYYRGAIIYKSKIIFAAVKLLQYAQSLLRCGGYSTQNTEEISQ